jgi:integrase
VEAADVEGAAAALRAGKAESTWRLYQQIRREWEAWCASCGASALPAAPETCCLYFAACAAGRVTGKPLGWSALSLRRSWISQSHQLRGLESPTWHPTVKLAFKGYRRSLAGKRKPKAALDQGDLEKLIGTFDLKTPEGLRNRALLLVGFGASLRRSELVALKLADVAKADDGAKLFIERSKTDQAAEGVYVGLEETGDALCPVAALHAWGEWLARQGVTSGPIFRAILRSGKPKETALCDREVARVIQEAAKTAGLDPKRFGGHSLRAGLATVLLDAGVGELTVAARLRHASLTTTRLYYRPKDPTHAAIRDALKRRKGK